MHVEHRLPAVNAGVVDDAVAAGIDSLALGQHPRYGKDVADQRLVLRLEFVDRLNVLVRHDQDVGRRDGVQVAEGGHLLIAVQDGGRRGSSNNFAEGAIRIHLIQKGYQSCKERNSIGFHEWDST